MEDTERFIDGLLSNLYGGKKIMLGRCDVLDQNKSKLFITRLNRAVIELVAWVLWPSVLADVVALQISSLQISLM